MLQRYTLFRQMKTFFPFNLPGIARRFHMGLSQLIGLCVCYWLTFRFVAYDPVC